MPANLQNWDDLRYFLAIAKHGGLKGAAEELGVNHSTMFRRLGALEEELDARLFDRSTRGYELTAIGESMHAVVARIEDDVHELDRVVRGHDRALAGLVRFTTVEELLTALAPHLERFAHTYPGIDLEVISEQRVLSLARREADVALRPGGRPREAGVIGKRLCDLATAVYASREYIDKHGGPRRRSELRRHRLVTFDDRRAHVRNRAWLEQIAPEARFSFRASTMIGQLTAVKANLGVALLPTFMADPEPDLVRLFTPTIEDSVGLWLLSHDDLRQTCRVRAFIEFITEVVTANKAMFEK